MPKKRIEVDCTWRPYGAEGLSVEMNFPEGKVVVSSTTPAAFDRFARNGEKTLALFLDNALRQVHSTN